MTAKGIHERLQTLADPGKARVAQSFFKTGPGQYGEGDRFFGIRVPQIRALAREFRDLELDELVTLLRSEWHEARLLALVILVSQYERGDAPTRKRIYDTYLANTAFINSWDLVDSSAPHIVGAQLANGSRALLTRLAKSKSIWERRIAMLATQHFIREGDFDDALRIATLLVADEHDLIHKAVGWMLREIGDRDPAAERAFLDRHAATMPRTALRYAIEKFPERERKRYLLLRDSVV